MCLAYFIEPPNRLHGLLLRIETLYNRFTQVSFRLLHGVLVNRALEGHLLHVGEHGHKAVHNANEALILGVKLQPEPGVGELQVHHRSAARSALKKGLIHCTLTEDVHRKGNHAQIGQLLERLRERSVNLVVKLEQKGQIGKRLIVD